MRLARARLVVALSGRRPLVPLAALVFAVIGVFAQPRNDVAGSWSVTAMLGFGLTAWLVVAVEREVPDAGESMLTVAAGGPAAAWRARLLVAALASALVTVGFIAYPLVFRSFKPPAHAGDVEGAVLVHAVSTSAGGALALLLARPVRPATAAAIVFAVLIALVALGAPLGAVAGPGGAAQAYADADGISARLLLAVAVAAVETGALALAARLAVRYRG